MVLPAVSLGFNQSALIARIARSCMLEVLSRTTSAPRAPRGCAEGVVVCVHAFRNALVPVVTVVGITMAILIGGAVVAEIVFTSPGSGRLIISAILRRDFPVLMGMAMFTAIAVVVDPTRRCDVAYSFLDPRIRYD